MSKKGVASAEGGEASWKSLALSAGRVCGDHHGTGAAQQRRRGAAETPGAAVAGGQLGQLAPQARQPGRVRDVSGPRLKGRACLTAVWRRRPAALPETFPARPAIIWHRRPCDSHCTAPRAPSSKPHAQQPRLSASGGRRPDRSVLSPVGRTHLPRLPFVRRRQHRHCIPSLAHSSLALHRAPRAAVRAVGDYCCGSHHEHDCPGHAWFPATYSAAAFARVYAPHTCHPAVSAHGPPLWQQQ